MKTRSRASVLYPSRTPPVGTCPLHQLRVYAQPSSLAPALRAAQATGSAQASALVTQGQAQGTRAPAQAKHPVPARARPVQPEQASWAWGA